ncbi:hypothetical protein GGP99_001714 [Salinibacter ruber]|uniref:Uncharacterized protein n=1 Tax=Salinibacter ruber TaxID=146919 RepID=A0AAW5P815_9BACT|nr:hypothetical protein [Salinibacter ruber]
MNKTDLIHASRNSQMKGIRKAALRKLCPRQPRCARDASRDVRLIDRLIGGESRMEIYRDRTSGHDIPHPRR